jgi:4'-phosphopantetheinyl transferase
MPRVTNRCQNAIVCSHFSIRIARYVTNRRVNQTMPTNRHWPRLATPPELAPDDVHAWAVPLDVSQQTYEELLATLAPDERQRASEFRFDDPRRRYVIARGTLRRLLGVYLHLMPSDIELTSDANQKPHLASKHATSGLQFNVSHSGELAMIGFALGCEIGIDVEQLRDVGHLEQIARRFFHPVETNDVLAAPEFTRSLAFLRCWTGKEAILKALGTGIVANLADFQVPISDGWQGWIECPTSAPSVQRSRCWLEQLSPRDDYVAAIACVETNRIVRSYTVAI